MFTLLTLKDILICVVSLETLLQISELGKTSCELIASFNSAIDCGLNKNYILLNKYYIIYSANFSTSWDTNNGCSFIWSGWSLWDQGYRS
jgi:hypothetical protein